MDQEPPVSPDETIAEEEGFPIEARASRSYRRTRYFVGAVFFATGLLFAYDGWVGWPKLNEEIAATEKLRAEAEAAGDDRKLAEINAQLEELGEPKSPADLLIQKIFFLSLSPGAVFLILNALYRSRGAVVFDGETISMPDGRVIPVDAIESVDNRRWDKKGIADFTYRTPEGAVRKFRLDDFIYDRPPIDRMQEILTHHVAPDETSDEEEIPGRATSAEGDEANPDQADPEAHPSAEDEPKPV